MEVFNLFYLFTVKLVLETNETRLGFVVLRNKEKQNQGNREVVVVVVLLDLRKKAIGKKPKGEV